MPGVNRFFGRMRSFPNARRPSSPASFLDEFYRPFYAVLLPHALPDPARLFAHGGIIEHGPDRPGKSGGRDGPAMQQRWGNACTVQHAAPECLVRHMLDDDGRTTRPASSMGRPGAAVMHHRRAARKHEMVLRVLDEQDFRPLLLRWMLGLNDGPAVCQPGSVNE